MRAGIERVWLGLHGDRRRLLGQAMRYGIGGVFVTLVQIGLYNLMSGPAHLPPLVANAIAFVVALMLSYTIHSNFSFRGHGERGDVRRTGGRFLTVALTGFAINSAWVWLFTTGFHWHDWTPSLPMFFVTPIVLFELNRRWVFE